MSGQEQFNKETASQADEIAKEGCTRTRCNYHTLWAVDNCCVKTQIQNIAVHSLRNIAAFYFCLHKPLCIFW